jgi:hypothetical protein
MLVTIMLAAAAAAAPVPATEVVLPESGALRTAIAERDSQLFGLVFERCDPAALEAMLTPDFEMYHDKDGLVARSAAPFVAQYAKDCAERRKPDSWRSRRELVPSSLSVHPVPGFGAIEEGDHLFYERQGDGPEKLAGRAHFVQLWMLAPDGWRLARVFSYAHQAAEE